MTDLGGDGVVIIVIVTRPKHCCRASFTFVHAAGERAQFGSLIVFVIIIEAAARARAVAMEESFEQGLEAGEASSNNPSIAFGATTEMLDDV